MLTLRVHDYARIPGTHDMRLVKTTPYVRLARQGSPPIYVQGGRVYSEGGPEVSTVPAWLPDELAKLTPTVRTEIGADKVLAALTPVAAPAPVAPAPVRQIAEWTCPELGCGATIPRSKKGAHVVMHKRRARREAAHGDG